MKQKTKKIKGGVDLKVDFSELKETITNLTTKPQPMIFKIEGVDLIKFQEWDKKHKHKCKSYKPDIAIDGRLDFIFTPTGLGTCIKVKCICGAELDLTDVDLW